MDKELEDFYYKEYLSEVEWLFYEDNYDPSLQPINESLFALGNGYLGSRGSYEETPYNTLAGTFFAGIFDESSSKVSELINAPNPFSLTIFLGESDKLDVSVTNHDYHQRILDLRKGFLTRQTAYQTNHSAIDYQSIRFISYSDINIAVMQVVLTPLTKATTFTVNCEIDTNVTNHGIILEKDCRNFQISERTQVEDSHFLSVTSRDHLKEIAYAQQIVVTVEGNTKNIDTEKFVLTLDKGQHGIITKYIVFGNQKKNINKALLKIEVLSKLRNAVQKGFNQLLQDHFAAFDKKWQHYDIQLIGDTDIQAALRFNLYHLMITSHREVKDVSIGAKMLSGEGYKGHVFWETELLLLPCHLFSEPILARQLLEYRFYRLEAAKKNAKERKLKGALFPWESADSGKEETPSWSEDLDATIKVVHTGKQSLHVNLAIFYAIQLYYYATNDTRFMLEMGLIMSIEMARFWISVVIHNPQEDSYEIKNVMGPDEFHESINNNAYTNKLVAWSLEKTLKFIDKFKSEFPEDINKLLKELKLYPKELSNFKEVSIKLKFIQRKKIISQFENFFSLKKLRTPSLDVFGIPNLPPDFLVVDLYKTQLIKQADVVLLLLLLPACFKRSTVNANFRFYENRTLHKSSWSPPIYSAVAAQLSFTERAYHYLQITLNTDKKNIFNNTIQGIHAPAVGGSWVSIVYGYCGIRIKDDILLITPHIPPLWQSITLNLFYLNFLVHLTVTPREVRLFLEQADDAWQGLGHIKQETARIKVCNILLSALPNKEYVIQIKDKYCSYKF